MPRFIFDAEIVCRLCQDGTTLYCTNPVASGAEFPCSLHPSWHASGTEVGVAVNCCLQNNLLFSVVTEDDDQKLSILSLGLRNTRPSKTSASGS